MNLQTFLPYVPFLAVIYALFALLQVLRHKRQGIGATLLALIAIIAPLIAYVLDADARASLIQYMLINALIVFVASLLTLLIERRNPQRDSQRDSRSDHSYGMLGIGVSVLLVVAMFALPLTISTSSASGNVPAFTNAATTTNNSTSGSNVLVSNVSQTTNNTADVQPEATQSADQTGSVPSGNFAPPSNTNTNNTQSQTVPQAQATEVATATEVPTEVATEVIARPTPIVFATSTPDVTDEAAVASAVNSPAAAQTVSNAATCTLVVDYNLNLRSQPTTDGSTVLLSIPYETVVTTDGKTADGWYRVTYNDQTGWVKGDYVTASASCSALSTLTAS